MYLGPVAPHWEVQSDFGDSQMIDDFRVRLAEGHRLRVQVASGAHPVYARNLGTGEPFATAVDMVAADQTVFHEPGRLSSITLPHFVEPR